MALSAEARAEIISLIVGMFNAAPGNAVLNELADLIEGGATLGQIAESLANTEVFHLVYPDSLSNGEFADAFVNNILSETSQEIRDSLIGDVEAILDSGTSRGGLMVLAIQLLREVDSDDEVFGASAAKFNNKVDVATYYSEDRGLSGADLDSLQAVLLNVSNLAESVVTAKQQIDTSNPAPGPGPSPSPGQAQALLQAQAQVLLQAQVLHLRQWS